jgi:hypothetical protein
MTSRHILGGEEPAATMHPDDGDRLVLTIRPAGDGLDATDLSGRPILVENFFEEMKRLVSN